MPASTPLRPRWGVVLVAVVVGLQLVSLLNPDFLLRDNEERYAAGHALALLDGAQGGPWALQYRVFCGGCVLVSGLAAAVFSVLPAVMASWKLVPIGFTALLAWVATRRLPAATAVGFLLLLALPPTTWLHLSLMGWGNHYEAGVLVAIGLMLLTTGAGWRVALPAGLCLGLALAVGFSGAFGVVGCALWLATQRRWRDLAWLGGCVGVVCGAVWLGQWITTSTHPFVTIYAAGEAVPDPGRAPRKLGSLLDPTTLAALFGAPWLGDAGRWLALGWLPGLVALPLGWRGGGPGRVAVGLMGLWITLYALVRFQVEGTAMIVDLRYAAPLYPLWFLAMAQATRDAWRAGHRLGAATLIIGPLIVGLASRAQVFGGRFPSTELTQMRACDVRYFVEQTGFRFSTSQHAFGAGSPRPLVAEMHANGLGRHAARGGPATPPEAGPTRQAWFDGAGAELAVIIDRTESRDLALTDQAVDWLAAVPGAQAADVERGMRALLIKWTEAAPPWLGWMEDERWGPLVDASTRLQPPAARGLWWVAGWRHGLQRRPGAERVPTPPTRWSTAYMAGAGYGMGEVLGPRAAAPEALEGPRREAWLQGMTMGRAQQWVPDPTPAAGP